MRVGHEDISADDAPAVGLADLVEAVLGFPYI
jgi:hypothetical protein